VDRIRVLVAGDDPALREALIELIDREASLDLVGVAEDAAQAIDLAERHHPEVALVNVQMPGGGGDMVVRELRSRSAGTQVIVLSAHEEREDMLRMLAAGVAGYLVKGDRPEEILSAIRECVEGGFTLSKKVTATLVEEIDRYLRHQERESEDFVRLSVRTHKVIEGDGLTAALQPVVDLRSGRVEGVEALARFDPPPDWGPREWFEEADAIGLRVDLELAALARCLIWLDRLPAHWFLSVNLSPDAITSEGVQRLLGREQAWRIVVEVTEHARVADYADLLEALEGFRSRGGRLAIDDAGAGFASLRHVVALQPDLIKLDMSLAQGIDRDRNRRALASAMISFAAEVGATIIAEGVETRDELDCLRSLGVRYGQGFYLGRPRFVLPQQDPAQVLEQTPPSAA
jgi:EAL domain-containing protein (putative c-di-GMP-specific phosphodiesterase class I)/CheY-like chemotaxis protein